MNDQIMCVTDAITASNLDEHGIFFGFVGNEAVEEKNIEEGPRAKPPA
ncbi:MAG: hypothetical protein ACRYFW_08570 [Janthinobacterium lividum]